MKKLLIAILVVSVLTLIVLVVPKGQKPSFGGVTVGNEYKATTTAFTDAWTDRVLDTGSGSLGSVVITRAGSVAFDLLNSTDAGRTPTTTLASFPANAAVGTYTFDVEYSEGLYVDVIEGTNGSSTITYR